ncbi:MAG: shikimate dehydrogenase [Lentilitoribacter sp.]
MTKEPIQAGVIGWPIHHSRSPIIHNYWLNQQSINGNYQTIAVSPDAADAFFKGFKTSGLAGFNITIPHKETVIPYLDHIDEAATAIGAVNTVWLEDGKMCGSNSDWIGFSDNLDHLAPGWDQHNDHALILGAGGAARGVIFALLKRGFENITVANRTVTRAEELADHFGDNVHAIGLSQAEQAIESSTLLINTTSLGMDNNPPLPLTLDGIQPDCLVTDIVYTPLETPLLKLAKSKGNKTVDGLGMLLHQAKMGSKLWFGGDPVVTDELRDLVLQDMGL